MFARAEFIRHSESSKPSEITNWDVAMEFASQPIYMPVVRPSMHRHRVACLAFDPIRESPGCLCVFRRLSARLECSSSKSGDWPEHIPEVDTDRLLQSYHTLWLDSSRSFCLSVCLCWRCLFHANLSINGSILMIAPISAIYRASSQVRSRPQISH